MGVADAMAEEFTYFCRCDVCRCSLFRGDNWYHKPGTNYDLCARDFAKLSAEERQACTVGFGFFGARLIASPCRAYLRKRVPTLPNPCTILTVGRFPDFTNSCHHAITG